MNFINHWFDSAEIRTPNLLHVKPALYRFGHRIRCAINVLCMYCMCIGYVLRRHYVYYILCIIYVLYMWYYICIVYVLYMYCICIIYDLYILYLHYICIIYMLYMYYMYCICIIYALYIYYIYIVACSI